MRKAQSKEKERGTSREVSEVLWEIRREEFRFFAFNLAVLQRE
jgi:hypothetical protein